MLLLSCFSHVWLCATPWTAAHQAPGPWDSPGESEKWKRSLSVVPDSSRPHGLQPTRLLRPWDFPGKSTGVGCHCLLQRRAIVNQKVLMSYVWLYRFVISYIWTCLCLLYGIKSNHKATNWNPDLRSKLKAVWFCQLFPIFLIHVKSKHSDESPLDFTSINAFQFYLLFLALLSLCSPSLCQIIATGLPAICSHSYNTVVKDV